jgi:hypothetical protein
MTAGRLRGKVVDRAKITLSDARGLFALFERHYSGVTFEAFWKDLSEKQWVVLLYDASNQIRGFTTLLLLDLPGEPVRAIFSGDTIIDRHYWGELEIVRVWCRFMGWLKRALPDHTLYWFLLSKGYRTYLFLPIYFHEFWPRHDRPMPERETRVLRTLAHSKFPEDFQPETGLIEFAQSHGHLREDLAEVPANRRDDPHVKYFLERNPRYAEGVELVCLAELDPANLKSIAKRMFLEGLDGRWPPDEEPLSVIV